MKIPKYTKSKSINILLIWLILAALSLGEFVKLQNGVALYDVLIVIYLFVNLWQIKNVLKGKIRRAGWLFTGVLLASFVLNAFGKSLNELVVPTAYLLRWTTYYLLFCLVMVNGQKEEVVKALRVYGLTVLTIGLVQRLVFPDMRMLFGLGWDDHYYRLIGTWFDPNLTGLVLVLAFLGELFWTPKKKTPDLFLILLYLVAIFLTYSRASYLALVGGLLFLYPGRRGIKVGVVTFLTIVGLVFLLPRPSGEGGNLLRHVSIDARLRSYGRGLEIYRTSPWYGAGYNFYKSAQENMGYLPINPAAPVNSASGNDCSLIFILATSGVVGVLAFLFFWGSLFAAGDRLVKAAMVAATLHSFFNNSIFFSAVLIWLWLVIGVSLVNGKE